MTDAVPSGVAPAAESVRQGRTTALELTRAALGRARETAALNAFASLDEAGAIQAAEELDAQAARGRFRGPLHGVPIGIKDLFNAAGLPARGGTRAPLPDLGPAEAPAVAALRAAGAVVIGKTNLHEVALGITGENSWTGSVLNPLDPARQAGGSSSGSAAAVAAGAGLASLGTDTGGSIRIPAALCGLVGFKPTWGRVSLAGALALSPTCDHAGPIVRSVEDARLVQEVLAGETLLPRPVAQPRLGVPRRYLDGALGPAVHAAFDRLLARLADAGAVLRDVDPEGLDLASEAYTPLVRAEAAHVHRAALASDPEGFSENVRTPLLAGLALPAVEYLEARRQRALVRAGLDAALDGLDGLVLPATPVAAPPLGTTEVELESGMAAHRAAFLRLTAPFSLVGLPVACVPFDWDGHLPLGLQVVGGRGQDAATLDLAAWVEALPG